MTKIEDEMESSVHDCWSITTDIATILKYSDDITRDIQSLTDVYDIKFRKLMDEVDQLLDELHNVRDTYDELKPIFDGKDGDTADKDFLLTPIVDKDLFGNPVDEAWMEDANVIFGSFGDKDNE